MHTIFTPQTREWPKMATQHPSAWGNIPTIFKDLIERSGIKTEKAIEFGVEFGYSTSALANYFNIVDHRPLLSRHRCHRANESDKSSRN